MPDQEVRQFKEGGVIFREGETSESAYVLIEGNVSLTKQGDNGPVTLALLHPGELFGEMSLLDSSLRSATARAIGDVRVRVVPREEFLDAVDNEPETARSVMKRLAERLRVANEMVASGQAKAAPQFASEAHRRVAKDRQPGFFARLFRAGRPRLERLEVRVATLAGDPDGSRTRSIIEILEKRRGIRVRHMDEVLDLDQDISLTGDISTQLAQAAAKARTWMTRTSGDLLIWGEIPAPGPTMQLRFVSRLPEDEDRPGFFGLATRFDMPVDFDPELGHFLYAAALSATRPAGEGKELTLADALPKAMDGALAVFQEMPSGLTTRERASVNACVGNVVHAVGAARGDADLVAMAETAFRAALEAINKDAEPLEWAMLQRNLGVVLQATTERSDDTAALEGVVDCYRNALATISKESFPRTWAALQNRVGIMLYRLDIKSGDTELVKHALAAYQAALQVYTRDNAPQRWAEVMSNVAQAALMLGGQLHSEEVLQKAVDACRGVLMVRTMESAPMQWAATQNNMGSALFLLGRLKQDVSYLDGAHSAFAQACDIYNEFDATRMAAVAEKNLARVEALRAKVDAGAGRSLPKMSWEDGGAP